MANEIMQPGLSPSTMQPDTRLNPHQGIGTQWVNPAQRYLGAKGSLEGLNTPGPGYRSSVLSPGVWSNLQGQPQGAIDLAKSNMNSLGITGEAAGRFGGDYLARAQQELGNRTAADTASAKMQSDQYQSNADRQNKLLIKLDSVLIMESSYARNTKITI